MVMFVKALIEDPDIKNPRIIVVTDRKDLDQQIRDTFKNCNIKKNVERAMSGQHLLDMIQEKTLNVVTTLVHKFDKAAKKRAGFIDDDKNLFVLVDEAHRSQYGDTADQMRLILRNACFIGFTGTPLLKKDKSRSKFGELIDRYTIDDALADGVVLPLVYEGRYVDTEQNAAQIDKHLERAVETFAEKNPGNEPKISMQKEITAKIIQSNPQRMEEIGRDIESHFIKNFQGTGLKAQAVAPSKYAAVVLQKYFETRGNVKTAVVISDESEKEDEFELEDRKKEVLGYLKKIKENHSSVEKYEKDVVDSFKKNDDGIEIIIVVDKLLTGFDAPRNTVLYLAKDLKDHTLLQAIARVNRLYENEKLPKTFGYVIDYSENAKNIDTAMKLFGNYDEDDVKDTLIDTKEKIAELEQSYALVQDLFNEIKGSSDDEEYLQFLADEPTRQSFYKAISSFVRNMNECYVLQDFVHQFKDLDLYKKDLKKLLELRGARVMRPSLPLA
jgi:type I restriction enzyme R subunit